MQQETIEHILDRSKTIAVVGLTSRASRPDHYVSAYLQQQGYRVIPVNPYEKSVLGEQAYPDLKAVPEPVDLVLLFRRSEDVPPHVEEAIEIGATAIWMQSGIINELAAQRARAAGLAVVMNACAMVEHRKGTLS